MEKTMFIADREIGFIDVINKFNYKIGIEIGVRDGNYSNLLLKNSNLDILYSVDCIYNQNAKNTLSKYNNRSKYIVEYSEQASLKFSDNFFDFIYIDAGHSYESVTQDIEIWWPKLKINGLIAGDDYTYVFNPSEGRYGVVEAINDFMKKNNLIYGVTGAGENNSIEFDRIARGYGKIIEKCLNQELKGITFGSSSNDDDIRIPQWYCFKTCKQ